jgi:CPA1 family monovalent cation:H+ antiporter
VTPNPPAPPVSEIVHTLAWLLLTATVVAMLAHRLRVPYAVLLVLGGLALGAVPGARIAQLDPELMLLAFLPPLLFDAAFRLEARWLASQLRTVLLLAVPGVVLTALAIGGVLWLVLGLPLPIGLLFGSLVAATDPVAVTAVFGFLRVGPRLTTMIEGESLINDGTAITLYTGLLGLVLANQLDLPALGGLFLLKVVGGSAIGAGLGLLAGRITRHVGDHLVEMTLSTALAYGSYLLAEAAHTSGPLACVAAGLIHGTYGRELAMSEENRRLLDDLWTYLGFLANGLVFLLLGLTVEPLQLVTYAWPALVAIAVVLAARVMVVWIASRLGRDGHALTRPEQIVTVWGGLRGALTVALALGIPATVSERDQLIGMAFAVVLFTLVVQGLTLAPLIRHLGVQRLST